MVAKTRKTANNTNEQRGERENAENEKVVRYHSDDLDPEKWLRPDIYIPSERTLQGAADFARNIDIIIARNSFRNIPADWKLQVPDWEFRIELLVSLFWFSDYRAKANPQLIAKDVAILRRRICSLHRALGQLPTPLWRGLSVGFYESSTKSVVDEVIERLEFMYRLCDGVLQHKGSVTRAGSIRSLCSDIVKLFELMAGRDFIGDFKLINSDRHASLALKSSKEFACFDAYFVQTVIQSIDPDISAKQIQYALDPSRRRTRTDPKPH